jgi:hypothetical protein
MMPRCPASLVLFSLCLPVLGCGDSDPLAEVSGGRFRLGIGVSHRASMEAMKSWRAWGTRTMVVMRCSLKARNQAIAVERGGASVAQTAAAEAALTGALGRLLAVVEAYPDLKATGNVAQLQEELTSTENKIGFARQLYNDTATQYNSVQQQFPANMVAGLAKATPAELWEITDVAERAVPAVDLSMKPTGRSAGPRGG